MCVCVRVYVCVCVCMCALFSAPLTWSHRPGHTHTHIHGHSPDARRRYVRWLHYRPLAQLCILVSGLSTYIHAVISRLCEMQIRQTMKMIMTQRSRCRVWLGAALRSVYKTTQCWTATDRPPLSHPFPRTSSRCALARPASLW